MTLTRVFVCSNLSVRRHELGKHFNSVMAHHDQAISANELLGAINFSMASSNKINGSNMAMFSSEEVGGFVSQLCEEEKVMKSEGFYYFI